MQDVQDEPLFCDRVAGLDIAKAEVEVTVRVPSDTTAGRRVRGQPVCGFKSTSTATDGYLKEDCCAAGSRSDASGCGPVHVGPPAPRPRSARLTWSGTPPERAAPGHIGWPTS